MTRTERKLRNQLRRNRTQSQNKEICLVKLFARVIAGDTENQREEDFLKCFDEYLKQFIENNVEISAELEYSDVCTRLSVY